MLGARVVGWHMAYLPQWVHRRTKVGHHKAGHCTVFSCVPIAGTTHSRRVFYRSTGEGWRIADARCMSIYRKSRGRGSMTQSS